MKDKSRKIAIIGAGAAGLSAAHFLAEKGYRNITIFEKSDRIGGCCKTSNWDGKFYDLGAFFIPRAHKEVRKLCKALDIELIKPYRFANLSLLKSEIDKIESLYNYKASKMRFAIHFFKFLVLKMLFQFKNSGDGYVYSDYTLLSCPTLEVLREKKMMQLCTLFYLTGEVLGYGHLRDKPFLYAIHLMKLGNCFNSIATFFTGRGATYTVKNGLEWLCKKLSQGHDVRLNSSISQIRMRDDGRLAIHCNGGEDAFDDVIRACRLTEAKAFLPILDSERELLDKEKLNLYWVTAFSAHGNPKINSTAYHLNVAPEPGGSSLIFRYWDDTDIYVACSYGGGEDVTKEKIVEEIKKEMASLGAVVTEIKEQTLWKIFPHIDQKAIEDGYYHKIQSLQGKNRIYYTGSSFTLETVGDVVAYSKQLVSKYF